MRSRGIRQENLDPEPGDLKEYAQWNRFCNLDVFIVEGLRVLDISSIHYQLNVDGIEHYIFKNYSKILRDKLLIYFALSVNAFSHGDWVDDSFLVCILTVRSSGWHWRLYCTVHLVLLLKRRNQIWKTLQLQSVHTAIIEPWLYYFSVWICIIWMIWDWVGGLQVKSRDENGLTRKSFMEQFCIPPNRGLCREE